MKYKKGEEKRSALNYSDVSLRYKSHSHDEFRCMEMENRLRKAKSQPKTSRGKRFAKPYVFLSK